MNFKGEIFQEARQDFGQDIRRFSQGDGEIKPFSQNFGIVIFMNFILLELEFYSNFNANTVCQTDGILYPRLCEYVCNKTI